jgi:hypothetical protein
VRAPASLDISTTRPVVVTRVVVRERVEVGLLAWVRSHEAASKQLLAVAVFLVLVMLTWLG